MDSEEQRVGDLVRQSPLRVGAQDKDGWIDLFAEEFVVEDPVGSRPVVGEGGDTARLAAFWDAFIADNEIRFTVHRDWIDGGDMFRDVLITTTMPTGAVVRTPAHLLYRTSADGAVLRITHMAAHWEPAPVYRQLAVPTPRNLRSGAAMGRRMLSNLGFGGTMRFVGAIRSPARNAKPAVRELAHQRGIRLETLIASGQYVTGTGLGTNGPVAVIAQIGDRGEVRELRVFDRALAVDAPLRR